MNRDLKNLFHDARCTAYFPWIFLAGILCVNGTADAAVTIKQQQSAVGIFPKMQVKTSAPVNNKDPVVINADDVEYDKESNTVTANGKVEIIQGETIILTDYLSYDQATNLVKARGNVSVLEPSGSVYFADEMELHDDMKAGVITQFKARMSDDSMFVAAGAKKVTEDITELHKATYSPCKVCNEAEGGGDPVWQLRADHVIIDQAEQEVSYDNARMEIYGTPVFYTPYFSHPTPGADNKSGVLEPQFQQNTNLGSVFKMPVYYTIAPDRDITLTPIYTSLEGPVGVGQYRQRYETGYLTVDGSATQPQDRDAGGFVKKGQNWRGHLNALGNFGDQKDYDWGFDVHRTSDDTYLRRYGFNDSTLLTSRIYGERYNFTKPEERSYAGIQTLRFDGLSSVDDSATSPLVLPLADFNWQSAPQAYGARLKLDGNIMSLTRETGADSRRLSTTAGLKLPYITSDGQVIEWENSVRTDLYSVDSYLLPNGQNYSGQTSRIVPQTSLTWRMPFINSGEDVNVMLEPVLMVADSPNSSINQKIPNEDSQVPEFNTSNLFSPNRFAGYDEVETGLQASYGLRGQAQIYNNKYIDWLVGQHYQQNNNVNFPYSNDLHSSSSDYVGKLGFNYDIFNLSYRTRLDKQTLSPKRNEVDASMNYYPFGFGVSYLSLKNDPVLQNKEEISGSAGVNLSRQWQWIVAGRRDLELRQTTSTSTGLEFKNECIDILNTLGKEYTQDRDIKPATTFLFRITLRNLE